MDLKAEKNINLNVNVKDKDIKNLIVNKIRINKNPKELIAHFISSQKKLRQDNKIIDNLMKIIQI